MGMGCSTRRKTATVPIPWRSKDGHDGDTGLENHGCKEAVWCLAQRYAGVRVRVLLTMGYGGAGWSVVLNMGYGGKAGGPCGSGGKVGEAYCLIERGRWPETGGTKGPI